MYDSSTNLAEQCVVNSSFVIVLAYWHIFKALFNKLDLWTLEGNVLFNDAVNPFYFYGGYNLIASRGR